MFSGISDKCPDPMPLSDGTICADEGQCKKGNCTSFCQIYKSPDWAPCTCEDGNLKRNIFFS